MSDNLFENANLEQGNISPWAGKDLTVLPSNAPGIPASSPTAFVLYMPAGTEPGSAVEVNGAAFVDVTPGERYRVTLLGGTKVGSSFRLRIGAKQFDGSRVGLQGYNGGDLSYVDDATNTWKIYSTILTVPSNAYYMTFGFRLDAFSPTSTPTGGFVATLLRAERLRDFVSAPTASNLRRE